MRMRERGIGNLPFIAVLVLFIVAVALFFMARNEADTFKAELDKKKQDLVAQDQKLVAARDAYDALHDVIGIQDEALRRNNDQYPNRETILNKCRDYLMQVVGDVVKASEAKLQARKYTVDTSEKAVKVIPGEVTTIRLYGVSNAKETVTFKAVLDNLPAQFRYAAKTIEANNQQFESEFSRYEQSRAESRTALESAQTAYNNDIANKQGTIDSLTQDKSNLQDTVNTLNAQKDTVESNMSTVKAEAEKTTRLKDREIRALKDRLINEKRKLEVALTEDPKDGEVTIAASRQGIAYINLGRRNHVARGQVFKVWRAGKGNLREDVAVIRVIEVDHGKAKARIEKLLNARVPVTAGMNISNPFYDPTQTLNVYIYGELRTYPTEVAKRRLAAAGAHVSSELDDQVNVIVLGEPPVTVGEAEEDEEAAALAARKASIEREKRLSEVIEKARVIGAIVVTEDVLRTFIEY